LAMVAVRCRRSTGPRYYLPCLFRALPFLRGVSHFRLFSVFSLSATLKK
jgi:hypothetical protein